VIGLLRRTALAVDRRRSHVIRETRQQPRRARHVETLLAGLGHAPADDLPDRRGIDAGPLDDLHLSRAQNVRRPEPGEPTVALPDGGAHCLDDYRLRHDRRPSCCESRPSAGCPRWAHFRTCSNFITGPPEVCPGLVAGRQLRTAVPPDRRTAGPPGRRIAGLDTPGARRHAGRPRCQSCLSTSRAITTRCTWFVPS